MGYYSAIKRNEIVPFAEMWMDLETVIQNEVSQKEKTRCHIILHICGIQKNGTDELICKAETETQMQRTNVWVLRGEGENGKNWEIGINIYTLLYIKQLTNNLLYSTVSSIFCTGLYEKRIQKKNRYMYMYN